MMKKTIVFLLLLLPILSFAQGRGSRNINPDTMALRQTQMMADSLVLSTAQTAKIQEVNLDFAKRLKATREQNQGDWENMRPAMQALRKEQYAAWDKYLTDDQLARWQVIQQQLRERRHGNRPDGPRNKSRKKTPQEKS